MPIYKTHYDLSSPEYIRNTEQILIDLIRSEHRIIEATLHGKPVYIVTDMALAKQIFEDGKNFSFTASRLTGGGALTEGAKAFVTKGLESPLLASSYDEYTGTRSLFNQAFKHCVTDRAESLRAAARAHIATLLDAARGPEVDMLALCRNYWMPLAANVIGLGALSAEEINTIAENARTLVEANGLHNKPDSIAALAAANTLIIEAVHNVIDANSAPATSAIGYLLSQVETQKTVDLTLSFILGGIDTGSTALALQTYLLAINPEQRARFAAMGGDDQMLAITELASKAAPAYYTPRFAIRDVIISDVMIPEGSFLHIPLYGLNTCANSDFNVSRHQTAACPHKNDVIPFGHARHRCPGELLARYLIPIYLKELFERYPNMEVVRYERETKHFSRSVSRFTIRI